MCSVTAKQYYNKCLALLDGIERVGQSVNLPLGSLRRSHFSDVPGKPVWHLCPGYDFPPGYRVPCCHIPDRRRGETQSDQHIESRSSPHKQWSAAAHVIQPHTIA